MIGSYFGFGSPQQQVDMHARSKKTLSLSYNMHLFLTYLLSDSQIIRLTIRFSKPRICMTLICGDLSDWSHFHFIMPVIMPDKAAFVRFVLLCVQRYHGNSYFTLQKQPLVAKNEFAFSFRPTRKDQQVGSNMLMFHVDVNMKRLGIHFKNDSFL